MRPLIGHGRVIDSRSRNVAATIYTNPRSVGLGQASFYPVYT